MLVPFIAFLLGITSGFRALTGIAIVSWAARLGYVPLEHTWLAFLGFAVTPYILSVMAIGELVNDKLPKTPSRLIPPQFIIRVVMGTFCGVALGLRAVTCWLVWWPGRWVVSLAPWVEQRQEHLAQSYSVRIYRPPSLRTLSPLA